ncbi:hypothetical protein EDD27_3152 [Nonomuraea polychroma]|uniref:Streptogrisin C n=1 Tax=Nonomuraea polychroma TaxID=46176 RepID=A0A438M504_9ACTN|nr:hypothetical protein [Nonomuraea polychroma]RVX40731.1 hypothetical protein EDD27_3152 [Nonomuraea polychroma]
MVSVRPTSRRGLAIFASTIAVATLSLSPAVPASAYDRPLAPLADTSEPVEPPEEAIKRIEDLNRRMVKDPAQWAGVWYDKASEQVVAALPPSASARTRSTARSAVGAAGATRTAARSFADLQRLANEIIALDTVASVPIASTGMDWEHNAVRVGLETVTDEARAQLAARYGDAVTVHQETRPSLQDGPDRWRDRYPYWGGSGWGIPGSPVGETSGCSTAFAMMRPDRSKKFLVTAGHCNSPTPLDAATANTAATVWDNVIGTSKGYQNSLCASTGDSCDIGSTKYGDISVIRVSGVEPRIYSGGARATTSVPVVSTQTGHPAVGDSMCVSGGTTGTTCGYKVVDNFVTVTYDNGQTMSPVVKTTNYTGACTNGGDSGGAVYKPVQGGARASGIHSGSNRSPGDCVEYYTSIYYAQQLFDAVTVTS